MGINQTSELYKGFLFDGIDSKGFGVYITGSAVYNAPEREIEEIEIPGRNGSYMLDRGRFHNVTVTYPAGMYAKDGEDFADGIRKLRNALSSRRGYCKLIDEYNPLEYRMAVYKGGLDVDPTAVNGDNKAAQFDIVFECKPQRYLIQGDEPVAVSSGGKLYNPTMFEARPLLKVNGYGTIAINGEEIALRNEPIGRVELGGGGSYKNSLTYHFDESPFNSGDIITVPDYRRSYQFDMVKPYGSGQLIRFGAIISESPWLEYTFENSEHQGVLTVFTDISTFRVGTEETAEYTVKGAVEYDDRDGTRQTKRVTVTTGVYYNGAGTIRFTASVVSVEGSDITVKSLAGNAPNFYGTSSKLPISGTVYYDLDIGEAYIIEDGKIIGVNNVAEIPAVLPVLKPADNTVTFPNTVTKLEIVPRWWEV